MKMGESAAKENENPCGLETELAEISMWLMKCPSLAASSLKSLPSPVDPYLPVAKLIISIDSLASVDDETKVAMELTRDEFGNTPKRYALEMSTDCIPMLVFSESSSHGKET
ncbi:hypothetical protein HID58_077651 [Brassica napus]|uniref:Uncharacterized protein n=1 Tax=Brassica napus TaxID=3708 RepID=A0ABQ7YS26_BRANA|nr:hypothetical protein HID58_077651 [Brassica napus]